MSHWKTVVDELLLWIGQLTVLQYRVASLLVCITGVTLIYMGPVRSVVTASSLPAQSSAKAATLRADRTSLEEQIRELDGKLERTRSRLGEEDPSSAYGRDDLVHVIDRASYEAPVRMGGLQAIGAATSEGRTTRQRYQLSVTGEYAAIAAFIQSISRDQSPVIIVEVAISSQGWAYPAHPLEAKLLVETISSPFRALGR
jgi:hypothetical protein